MSICRIKFRLEKFVKKFEFILQTCWPRLMKLMSPTKTRLFKLTRAGNELVLPLALQVHDAHVDDGRQAGEALHGLHVLAGLVPGGRQPHQRRVPEPRAHEHHAVVQVRHTFWYWDVSCKQTAV